VPDRITLDPSTELVDAEARTRARWSPGQMGRRGKRTSRGSCVWGTSRTSPGETTGRRLDPALEKRGGRSFGAAPSEVHRANTLTSSTSLATGHTMSCRPIGAHKVPGAGGSSSVLTLCP
jgi:hypothetical protein